MGSQTGVAFQGVVKQMLDRAATGSSCLYGHKLAIDDAGLLPSPCTDFRNVGRVVVTHTP